MSPASSYIQPEQMSESEGDLGRLCTCLHCCNCETWRRKHNGLRMHKCWRCGQLTICEGTMNSPNYCKILEHQMLPLSQALFTRRLAQHWIFQQDNALCHTARSSKADERAWSPASGLACAISGHESNREYVAHHQGSSF